MDATAYRATIARLGLTQAGAAHLVGSGDRNGRRWASGDTPVPGAVQRLLYACERDPELLRLLRDEWEEIEGTMSDRRYLNPETDELVPASRISHLPAEEQKELVLHWFYDNHRSSEYTPAAPDDDVSSDPDAVNPEDEVRTEFSAADLEEDVLLKVVQDIAAQASEWVPYRVLQAKADAEEAMIAELDARPGHGTT